MTNQDPASDASEDELAGYPSFVQEWVRTFRKQAEDPNTDISGWFDAEAGRLELQTIETARDEATRRTAEAALITRVALHVALKERQLANAIHNSNLELQKAVNSATKRTQAWLIILTGLLVVVGAVQALATIMSRG